MAEEHYANAHAEAIFARAFNAAFPDLGSRRVAPELKLAPVYSK
jgi:hypothetical protein